MGLDVVLLWIVVVAVVGDEKAVAPCGCNDAARAITSAKMTGVECEMLVGCIVSVSRLTGCYCSFWSDE